VSAYVSVCVKINSRSSEQTLIKFFEVVGHGPETNRLYFDGNLDHDPGILILDPILIQIQKFLKDFLMTFFEE